MVGRAKKVGSKCFVGDLKVGEKITSKKKPKKRLQHTIKHYMKSHPI